MKATATAHYGPCAIIFIPTPTEEKILGGLSRCNRLFCEKVLEVVKKDDFVWIQDYQLMLPPDAA
jgi:trehalose-6-phosphate synthase